MNRDLLNRSYCVYAPEVSIIIPNYNGAHFLKECFCALRKQSYQNFEMILVDNGSTDETLSLLEGSYSDVRLIALSDNYGFSRAVNEGIKAARGTYVVLLNNDTRPEEDFLVQLLKQIKRSTKIFSCQSKLLMYHSPDQIDDAGDFYTCMGWAYARGKGEKETKYNSPCKIFSSCAGAAIYRKAVFEEIGYFDENFFAYLEDLDIGFRARIFGYTNRFAPNSRVLHIGSGTSGSRYNEFKVKLSARNNVYLIRKNMTYLMLLLNFPFLIAGFFTKYAFFKKKGFGKAYFQGLKEGLKGTPEVKKMKFRHKHMWNYIRIQIELWVNVIHRLRKY